LSEIFWRHGHGDDWSAVLGSVVEVGHGLLIREGCLIAGVLHVGDGLLIGLNGGLLCGLSSLLGLGSGVLGLGAG